MVKNPPANAGHTRDKGSIPESGRSPGVGSGNHSSILAWKIPWMEEPCGHKSLLKYQKNDSVLSPKQLLT